MASRLVSLLYSNFSVLPKRNISQGKLASAIYKREYVTPNPDPQVYNEDLVQELARSPIKAAPSGCTYSNFYDPTLQKFEKMVLKRGLGHIAARITQRAVENIKSVQVKKYHRSTEEERKEIEVDPIKIFNLAMDNAQPILGIKKMVKGSQSYQVPYPLTPKERSFKTFKWVLDHVRSGKPNNDAAIRLANEILAAYNGQGYAIRKKQELHKQAEANRAYAHCRWDKNAKRPSQRRKRKK